MAFRDTYRPSTEAQRCEETGERNAVRASAWWDRRDEYRRLRRRERRFLVDLQPRGNGDE